MANKIVLKEIAAKYEISINKARAMTKAVGFPVPLTIGSKGIASVWDEKEVDNFEKNYQYSERTKKNA